MPGIETDDLMPDRLVTSQISRDPRIRTVPIDERTVALIAECLDVVATVAPFRLPSSTVYQLTVPGTNERPAALLTIWPGIRRVDVVAGPATIVFTDVVDVDLVPQVEVQFRRKNREFLVVARGGKVIVRA